MDWIAALTGVYLGREQVHVVAGQHLSWTVIDQLRQINAVYEALRPLAQRQYEGDRSDRRVFTELDTVRPER